MAVDGASARSGRKSAPSLVPVADSPPLTVGQAQLDAPAVPLHLYGVRSRVDLSEVPVTGPLDHTMAADLDEYVRQRIPVGVMEDALLRSADIEVHGVYPAHFAAVATRLGARHVVTIGALQLPGKRLNGVRPQLFTGSDCFGRERLFVAVPPGRDYVLHYASLVRHLLRGVSPRRDSTLSVWRYPRAEREIAEWTGLDATLVEPGDTVVLGKVELLRQLFQQRGRTRTATRATAYYSMSRHRFPHRQVAVLGVNFSYWGSIAAVLAHRCCELGAREVVYLGKLGTLSRPQDVYSRLFVPSRYGLLQHLTLTAAPTGPPNGLLQYAPALDSGLHLSVPTVLEEDHQQREVAVQLGATTVDNEMAQMATAVDAWNAAAGTEVRFSGLHYATDYLRHKTEARLPVRYSLTRGRSEEARRRRHQAERMAGSCLDGYLAGRG